MIEVKNVNLTLQKNEILKSDSVNFKLGKIHGLIGRNGSGKTMLMKYICGFVKPTSGEITKDDIENTMRQVGLDPDERLGQRRRCGYAKIFT